MRPPATSSPWPSPTESRSSSSPCRARSSASTAPTSSIPGTNCACAPASPAHCARPWDCASTRRTGWTTCIAADTVLVPACARARQFDPPPDLLDALRQAHDRGRTGRLDLRRGLSARRRRAARRPPGHDALDERGRLLPPLPQRQGRPVGALCGRRLGVHVGRHRLGDRPVPAPGAARPRRRGGQRGGPPDGGAPAPRRRPGPVRPTGDPQRRLGRRPGEPDRRARLGPAAPRPAADRGATGAAGPHERAHLRAPVPRRVRHQPAAVAGRAARADGPGTAGDHGRAGRADRRPRRVRHARSTCGSTSAGSPVSRRRPTATSSGTAQRHPPAAARLLRYLWRRGRGGPSRLPRPCRAAGADSRRGSSAWPDR